jgi:hypothetical protein
MRDAGKPRNVLPTDRAMKDFSLYSITAEDNNYLSKTAIGRDHQRVYLNN